MSFYLCLQTGLRRSKLNTLVDFPVDNLNMSPHLTFRNQAQPLKQDDYTYDLLGVSNHYGNMMGGHYIAYCRSPVDGEWREFNDTKVRILEGPIATREAYLLFYQRRSLSKDINQRLFTGDHWVFSLPLAPSERIEESLISRELLSWNSELGQQPRRSRSRSASPSAHRQANRDGTGSATRRVPTRPLTPQPFKRPLISYIDDNDVDEDFSLVSPTSPERSNLPRKSRPVQRQFSAPGLQVRREKSAGAPASTGLKDPNRTLYNRRSIEVDQKDFSVDQSKKISKPELSNDVVRSQSQTRPKPTDREKPQVTVVRHDPPYTNDLAVSTSKTISHQALLNNSTLESDAKYPSSSFDHTRYSDSRKGTSNFEPASILQVKFDDKDSFLPVRSQKSYDSSLMSDSENARKKLAQLIKQDRDSLNKALAERAHISIDPIEEENSCNFVRAGSRRYDTHKSLDLAKHKPLNFDLLSDVNVSQRGTNGHSFRDTLSSVAREGESDRWLSHSSRFGNRGTGYSLLEESEIDSDDYDISPELSTHSEFRSKLPDETHYEGFRKLADKHFGSGTDGMLEYNKERYRSRISDDTEYQTSGKTL